MATRGRRYLSVTLETLLDDPQLLRHAPAPTATGVYHLETLNLETILMNSHKVSFAEPHRLWQAVLTGGVPLFDVEREINRLSAEGRLTVRAERSAPLLAELEAWLRAERARLSRHAPVAKAMDYMLKRWPGFARFLEDGRVCLTNNAAERALRGIALGRKAWLFAGSDRGGHRAAFMYTLIVTAKINDVDPQAWLADVLARIADHSSQRLDELLPWNWKQAQAAHTLAA